MRILSQAEQWPQRVAYDSRALTEGLRGQFEDWWKAGGHDDSEQHRWGVSGQPLTYWPNIERFLKDRYPAAHNEQFQGGQEDAGFRLDNDALRAESYGATGQDYDPAEIAAGMLMLHNQQPGRQEMGRDINRLYDIVKKRNQMQRDYEQRIHP